MVRIRARCTDTGEAPPERNQCDCMQSRMAIVSAWDWQYMSNLCSADHPVCLQVDEATLMQAERQGEDKFSIHVTCWDCSICNDLYLEHNCERCGADHPALLQLDAKLTREERQRERSPRNLREVAGRHHAPNMFLTIRPCIQVDAATLTQEERQQEGIRQLPSSLTAALDTMNIDKGARRCVPDRAQRPS